MVKQFRKKPVVIEAIKFERNNWDVVCKFTNYTAENYTIEKRLNGKA